MDQFLFTFVEILTAKLKLQSEIPLKKNKRRKFLFQYVKTF